MSGTSRPTSPYSWVFRTDPASNDSWYQKNPQVHVLYKPIEELKDEITNDLLEIRMKIKYSTTIQDSEEVQLRHKIAERIYDYFYDSDPRDIDKLVELIEFKEWPQDFGVPDALSVNGKQEGPTLLILLKPVPPKVPEFVIQEKRKRYIKIDKHRDSKHSIKNLSRIHSMKARRK